MVRVHAASVNATDWQFLTGIPYVLRLASGILRPRRTIPGRDLAGRVEVVGGSVTRFRVGDEVFGTPGDELRNIIGTFAEYVVAPETGSRRNRRTSPSSRPQRHRRPESLRFGRSEKGTSNRG